MRRFLYLLWLKLVDIGNMKALMLMVLLLPPVLGLIAGHSNLANRDPDIHIGLVDTDQSAASKGLAVALREQGWQITQVKPAQARQWLLRHSVDGILVIPPGFADSLHLFEPASLSYTPSEGTLTTNVVREAIAAVVLPEHSRIALLEQLTARYRSEGRAVPPDIAGQFAELMAAYAEREARLDMIYIGPDAAPPALTDVVSDDSMQVLFLSLYAVIGVLGLTDLSIQRRLSATRSGLLLDYLVSLGALLLLGCLQILLYTTAMHFAMATTLQLRHLLLMLVFVYFMLGLGQLLSLIHKDLRVFLSLLLMVLMAVAGGCFFRLPQLLLARIGQYTPHGWVLSAIQGYPVMPAIVPLLAGTWLLVLGYVVRRYRIRQNS